MTIRPVPFKALGGLYEQDDIEAAVQLITAASKPGGSLFPLPEETDFHEALAAQEGAAYAVGTNSCGTALGLT